jgi:predicted transposase YdaD
MQESVIYQEWREEFLQEGEQTGALKEGQLLILRQLTRRIGEVALEMRSQIQDLSLAQLEALGEALLDFTGANDLSEWMQRNS